MRKGNLPGKIFGIALALVMIAAMLALGGFAFQGQTLAQEGETWYVKAHSAHFASGYYVELAVHDPDQTIQSVDVTGPGIDGSISLVYGPYYADWWWSRPNVDLGTDPPTDLPLVYTFTITDKIGDTYTLEDSVESYMHEFATNLSPRNNQTVIGELVFSWTGVSISGVRYKIELYDDDWNRVWDSPFSSSCSIAYDGAPLSPGNYQYHVCCFNEYGDSSFASATFKIGTPHEYESLEYFKITEGHGIKYHVTDDWGAIDCNVWAVSQYFETNKPHDLDFVFTLVEEGTEGGVFWNSSIGGEVSRSINGKDLTLFYAGAPVSNQGNFYFHFSLPRFFSSGDEWSTWGDKEYSAEYVGSQTVNGTDFDDCIKISIDDSLNDSEYLRGTGYFILARDIGIVKLVFNRTNGQTVLYEYVEHEQLTKHTISGTITDGGVPVEGIIVQISVCNWGIRSVTDSSGAFSIQVYGPDIILRIGYDEDNDDVFESDHPNFPRKYRVNNITSDITGLNIDIAGFWVRNVAQLRDALYAAASNAQHDVIKIAQGTYNTGGHSFHYRGDDHYAITISGGWNSDFTAQELHPTNTVLNNDAPPCSPGASVIYNNVLSIGNHGGGDITIEGVTVQNGKACLWVGKDDHFGGCGANIYSNTGNINFSHNRAIGNSVVDAGGEPGGDFDDVLRGAGLRAETAGDVIIEGNVFSGNTISGASVYERDWLYGAGAVIETHGDGNILLENNVFSQNTLEESGTSTSSNYLEGAGAYVRCRGTGDAHISGNIVMENAVIGREGPDSGDGVGFWVLARGGKAHVKNNIIASNYMVGNGGDDELWGGGIKWWFGEESHFINNTVAFNEFSGGGGSDEARGGGVSIHNYDATVTSFFFNNIVWGNTIDAETIRGEDIFNGSSASNICYNDFSSLGGQPPANTCPECGTEPWGNVNVDPLFVNPEEGDFRLQAGSPVIDMGTAFAPGLPDTDIEGNPRILDAAPDMGAYESSVWDPMVYDADGDGGISKSEAIQAVIDYFDGVITKEQAIEVVLLYFG